MDESNRLRPLGETRTDTYSLVRTTLFAQVEYSWRTAYVEGIDAASFGEELPAAVTVYRPMQYRYLSERISRR